MTPIKATKAEARRLKRNLEGKGSRKHEDPEATIRRLRAEIAVLREMLEQKQDMIDALNREIGAREQPNKL